MIRIIMIGFWACLMTLAAGYATTHFRAVAAHPPVAAPTVPRELKKTREFNVPKIRDGAVKGYVVVQLSYVVDNAAAAKASVPPDPFIVDEAFRYIYDDPAIDFDHLETFDLNKMTKTLIKSVNARLGGDVITDIGVQEFTILTALQAKGRL